MSEPKIDLEKEAGKLAKEADLPVAEVVAGITEIIEREGRSPFVALLAWKARNSLLLGAGKVTLIARVIAKEAPRDTPKGNKVCTVHLAIENPESHEIEFKESALWDDRIEKLWEKLPEDACITFSCSIDKKGRIQRLDKIELIADPAPVPKLAEIEPRSLGDIDNSKGSNDVVEGWVGRNAYEGIDLVTLDVTLPLRVWYGGQYARMTPEAAKDAALLVEGDHIKAFGFITPTGSLNAVRILKL